MSASKWTTSRIDYDETGLGGNRRYRAYRTDKHGVPHEGFGNTKPHAKAAMRKIEDADEASRVLRIQTTQPQLAAE